MNNFLLESPETLLLVCAYLSAADLSRLSTVSRTCRGVCTYEALWAGLLLAEAGSKDLQHTGLWRLTYIRWVWRQLAVQPAAGPRHLRQQYLAAVSEHAVRAGSARFPLHISEPLHRVQQLGRVCVCCIEETRPADALLHSRSCARSVHACAFRAIEHAREHARSCAMRTCICTLGGLPPMCIHDVMREAAPGSTHSPYACTIPRVCAKDIDAQRFRHEFEHASLPCMLTDMLWTWPCMRTTTPTREAPPKAVEEHDRAWSPDALARRCGGVEFQLSHRAGQLHEKELKLSITMREYVAYMRVQSDPLPLYVFDAHALHAPLPDGTTLLHDFDVLTMKPCLFEEDMWRMLGGVVRPDFRWIIVGPARTGAPWHVDPHCTSAWNALLHGRKLWALYPPTVVPPGVAVQRNPFGDMTSFGCPLSPIQWYAQVYPLLTSAEKPIEVVQHAGEVIFIPTGWWHMVLNLEETVSVTQNFVSRANFDDVVADVLDRSGMTASGKDGNGGSSTRASAFPEADFHRVRSHGVVPIPLASKLSFSALWRESLVRGMPGAVERFDIAAGFRAVCRALLARGSLKSSGSAAPRSYSALQTTFRDAKVWVNALSLLGMDASAGVTGLSSRCNVVLATSHEEQKVVVKIFGPSSGNSGVFQLDPRAAQHGCDAERMVCDVLSTHPIAHCATPRVLRSTVLLKDEAGWRWPTLTFDALPGVTQGSFRRARAGEMTEDDAMEYMPWLGTILARLHTHAQLRARLLEHEQVTLGASTTHPLPRLCPRSQAVISASRQRRCVIKGGVGAWQPYVEWLATLCSSAHGRRLCTRSIPAHLLATMSSLVPHDFESVRQMLLPLAATTESVVPAALHGDVSCDNVIGDVLGRWYPSGLIDFADARCGDPLLDFVPVFLAHCMCNADTFQAFYDAYARERGALDAAHSGSKRVELPQNPLHHQATARRFMLLLLIHPVDGFALLETARPGLLQAAESWEHVQRAMFPAAV